jgi:predicted nucleotidyltransferase
MKRTKKSHGLKKRDVEFILTAVKQFPEIEQAIIFGSRALGNYKRGSDVDIAVIGKELTDKTITRLSALLNEDLPLPYFFDVVSYEKLKNEALKKHIDSKGYIVYKNGS